jgi:hypothetical protein
MTMRSPSGGFISAGYDPLKTPNAPTIGTASSASATSISVAFTAPANIGGSAITAYTVFSSGGQIATGTASPIVVTGLTTGTAYTFTVLATNNYGSGPVSAASNSATPVAQGQQAYTTAGTYSWVAPAGITSVSVVAVGGGAGGGGGGALAYKNNISVTPGSSYSVVVGANGVSVGPNTGVIGGNSSFTASFGTMTAGGGQAINGGTRSGTFDGGGSGGACADAVGFAGYCGGGAGGYSGNGGNGGYGTTGRPGAGGGGAGGDWPYGAGGGVGILGEGTSGSTGGQGGSGGTNASSSNAGTYGGASGGSPAGSLGGVGAVRIIWPGGTRSFPSTNTGNL